MTIQSYFDNFKKNLKRSDKVDYNSLQSFLRKQNTSQLKIYSENIFNALLHVLSIGNVKIKKQEIKRSYNKSLLLEKLQIEHPKTYRKLLSDIAIWSKKIHCSETNNLEVLETIKKFILNEFISIFNIPNTNKYLNSFLNNVPEELVTEEELKSNNTYLGLNDISIELGTIHSVKGETHCATLYLETCYFGKHESERIINQLKGRPINSKASIRTKETLKMAYVGMSRPKYLLCLAMHKNRYDNELDIKNGGNWEVIDLTDA